MAYNKRNLYETMIEIQDITLDHTARGVSQEWIFVNIIKPKYKISRTTYYNYLGCNAKAELTRLNLGLPRLKEPENQMKLF